VKSTVAQKKLKGKNPNLIALGEKLTKIRKGNTGLAQDKFADFIGLHRTYVSGIESGSRNPSYLTLLNYSEKLGISISDLLK
jgi:transcriptional regulator with XRE-family HTH domain